MLEVFGLTSSADGVYRSLLRHPNQTVADLADGLGLGKEDVTSALTQLRDAGLAFPSSTSALTVLSPQAATEVLMARQKAELAAMQMRIERSHAMAGQLLAEYSDINAGEESERVIGADAIRTRLARLARETEFELLTFAPGGAHQPADLEASRNPNIDVFERGVRSRTIYLSSARSDPATLAHITWLNEQGAEVRTTPALPVRMIISDRRRVVLPIDTEETKAGVVVTRGPGAVAALCALFEHVWAEAVPLGTQVTRDRHGLSEEERVTLRLLAEGKTDDAVGRRTGVSERTARRIAKDLMYRLGAKSRFEAGFLAAKHGWLE